MLKNSNTFSGSNKTETTTFTTWNTSNYASGSSQTLYARATDTSGNYSDTTISVTIASDKTAPTGSISINSGATYTNSTSVTLSLYASDPSGVSQMCVSIMEVRRFGILYRQRFG
ncbi:MAG: hypothetical protein HY754_05685 [Nitrospirae bacterium]|nr:hypothetical protein [Nitrospirota bacterium]